MRVLITGSAGFIGSGLSLRLLERGDEVIGVDCLDPYYDVSLKEARLARTLQFDGYTDIRARIEDRDSMTRSFVRLHPDLALDEARARDAEAPLGPLHGVPFAVKDIFETVDLPTEFNSPLYQGFQPARDAAAVALLRAAGALFPLPHLLPAIADIYSGLGRHDEALVAYRRAAELAPDDPRWPYLAALAVATIPFLHWIPDDAFISLQYARSVAEGDGLDEILIEGKGPSDAAPDLGDLDGDGLDELLLIARDGRLERVGLRDGLPRRHRARARPLAALSADHLPRAALARRP